MSSIFDRLTRALPWNKPIELPEHHQWKHANIPALLEWRIKARPYNIIVANGMFLVVFVFATLMFGWMGGLFNPESISVAAIGMPFYLLTMAAVYGTTHQKTKFAYRFTEQGIEVCEWKAPGKGWMIALKWLTVIAAIAVIFVIALDPSAFWIALAGPGGMGLLYLSLANSSKYQEMHTEYHHRDHSWDRYKKISIHPKRPVIGLHFDYFNTSQQSIDKGVLFLYCKEIQLNSTLGVVGEKLPGIPSAYEAFDIY
ncbi:hypothetical protein [Pseudomonas sp.]|uniref:hypothetical protein n=1 Tax=Pseudomonas sp. TaxID=306 RepID=UPI002736F82C|nr:hypothetical protein [Pseudomonas sp.]MDP2748086.1 hypothetical protein [Pseudomonas sp.]